MTAVNAKMSLRFQQTVFHAVLLGFVLVVSGVQRDAIAESAIPQVVTCPGEYRQHLQGVCADPEGNLFWSFTSELVKTDSQGKLLLQIPVASHHGDLCYHDGRIFVAVNLGKFNQPAGQAKSWVYEYDASTLKERNRFPVPEVVHGAGGMDFANGSFFVVGGLPRGIPENYLYEYTPDFQFQKRHVLKSGETLLGIQVAHFHGGVWWLGCYGKPPVLLKADAKFQMQGQWNFNGAVGLLGVNSEYMLVAVNRRTPNQKNEAKLVPARIQPDGSLSFVSEETSTPSESQR